MVGNRGVGVAAGRYYRLGGVYNVRAGKGGGAVVLGGSGYGGDRLVQVLAGGYHALHGFGPFWSVIGGFPIVYMTIAP